MSGLGLALGVMSATGSADRPPALSAPSASVGTAPGRAAPVTAPQPTINAIGQHADKASDRKPQRGETYATGTVTAGRPVGIVVRRLGIDTTVSAISSVDGSLIPPADYTTVGWWADGPAPGAKRGTAIITGHTVHSGGGAFDDLGELHSGDRVVVERPRRDLEYVVDSVTTYDKGALAERAAEVFRPDVEGRLALVTCADWNGEIYLSNVVVIATAPRPLRG